MTVHPWPSPSGDRRFTLAARIRSAQADIDALGAQRDAREAELRRMILELARLPGEVPPVPAQARAWLPIKAAARQSGRSTDTLRRHGEPAGWCWRQGGRWVVDPAGLADFLAPRRVG